MKRMARMGTKKSYSWWWDSHISPKNSKWLAGNLEDMDRCVKEMLKLIEEEGDSFQKKADMYFQRRPDLIAHVEDFYRMYRALAERYDNVTGELRKNVPSELQSQNSGTGSDFGSETDSPSPESIPERKPPRPKPGPRAAGFDFFLGAGGNSNHSREGSDGSSSSESDSDSDDVKDANGDDTSSALHQRILDLESELHDAKERFLELEGNNNDHRYEHVENVDHVDCTSRISSLEKQLMDADAKLYVAEDHVDCTLRISSLEKQLMDADAKLYVAETEILSMKKKLADNLYVSEEVEPRLEKNRVQEQENTIAVMEVEISQYKQEIENLKGDLKSASQQFEDVLSQHDGAVEALKAEISSLTETYLHEKSIHEGIFANLEGSIDELKNEIKNIAQEKSLLEDKDKEQDHMIWELQANAAKAAQEKCTLEARVGSLLLSNASLESNVVTLLKEVEHLEAENARLQSENGKHIEELNNNLSAVKLNLEEVEHLEAENARLQSENGERIEELNNNLSAVKLNLDRVTSEKEELGAKVSTLIIDVKSRDGQISELNQHLDELHLEHVRLITQLEATRNAAKDLNSQVKVLEEEVDRQKATIVDSAEGKREAIRQLCFSLEHYQDGYRQLCRALKGHKRHAFLAT